MYRAYTSMVSVLIFVSKFEEKGVFTAKSGKPIRAQKGNYLGKGEKAKSRTWRNHKRTNGTMWLAYRWASKVIRYKCASRLMALKMF